MACRTAEYGVLTVPSGVLPVACNALLLELAFTFNVCADVTVYGTSLESMACSVNEFEPTAVGVPERMPVVVSKLSPAGNDPVGGNHFTVGVPPETAKVALYGVPTVASGVLPVICGAGLTTIAVLVEAFTPVTVPVSVTVVCCVTAGATYVAPSAEVSLTVPHVWPEQPEPETDQVSGRFEGLLATAMKL